MPVNPTYPGVYIEEISSGVRTIMGVSTSTTAFVGRAKKGPVNKATLIHNFGDFTRIFGGLWEKSTMSFAVYQYFGNGGKDAVIVRVISGDPGKDAKSASVDLGTSPNILTLEAKSPGEWGNNLRAEINHVPKNDPKSKLFNLTIKDLGPSEGGTGTGDSETLRNLSLDTDGPSFSKFLDQNSTFVRVKEKSAIPNNRPDETAVGKPAVFNSGNDGVDIKYSDLVPADEKGKKGICALADADIFNLLCIPPLSFENDFDKDTRTLIYENAASYCKKRRAMLLMDPPQDKKDPASINEYFKDLTITSKKNAAFFFPRIKLLNPLKNNLVDEFVPCGAVAGVFARTDAERGVWKAPAGIEATLSGVSELSYTLTDDENGDLNKLGINCLRTFPLIGNVIWGSRTVDGADQLASEWKYIPVRRLALFIEESLFRGTKWVVFEPNDEPLWAQIRLNIGAFMHNLFRQGAFMGKTPREAYFVKCDRETTTQNDIDRGIVNIIVGFAPLKPAEFVIIKIQQIAGEIQT